MNSDKPADAAHFRASAGFAAATNATIANLSFAQVLFVLLALTAIRIRRSAFFGRRSVL